MKLLLVLTLLSFQVVASGYAQNINLKASDKSLKEILLDIRKQTGYHLIYKTDLLANASPVTVDIKNASLAKTLKLIFDRQPLDFEIKDKTILIKKKKPETDTKVTRQSKIIKGTITDSLNRPLAGVTVTEKGTSNAVTSNQQGIFLIEVKSLESILLFSFVGYRNYEVSDIQPDMNIIMMPSSEAIEEVVAVGYGTQKKISVVSSISRVKGESLRFPTRSLSNNIAGQVAGVIAIQRSGEPGYDNSEFWIRGVSSFAGGKSPLVLVDGIPRAMNDIEPDEIETFSVLKDAAATAVYGAEGANGVVLITSKRGSTQKPVISFRTEHSFSQPTRLPKFVGSVEYLTLYNEAVRNDGQQPIFSEELIEKYRNGVDPELYPNTDWMGSLLKSTTDNHRYTLNVRGGSERARYFVSGAYFNEGGLFKDQPENRYETNIGVKRYNLRSNIDLDVSKTTTVSVDLSGQYLINNYPGKSSSEIFSRMTLTPPYLFPAKYNDGTIATYPIERTAGLQNPYNMLVNSGYSKEWRSSVQSNIQLLQKLDFITSGLNLKGNVSYDYMGDYKLTRTYSPSRFFATGRDDDGKLIYNRTYLGSPDLANPTQSANSTKKIYIESSLNYSKSFGGHNVGGMILYMQKETHFYNQPLPNRKQGVVGRATYGYDNRYFIEGNFGYTGSETFAKGYRFGFFPAVGVGYQVSNEQFYPEALKTYISNLKLRFSAGRTGNDDTGGERFLYRGTYVMNAPGFSLGMNNGGATNPIDNATGNNNGITEGRFNAPHIRWEIEDKFNYGIDLGFLNNRIELTADYFTAERSGILLQRKIVPSAPGFSTAPWQNYGRVKNWGVDASLTAHEKIGAVDISARGTFTFARNKITEYDELEQPYPWLNVTGTRINEPLWYIAERLYTEDDFIVTTDSNGAKAFKLRDGIPNPTLGGRIAPGDIKYKDLNGDGTINNFDQTRGIGHTYVPEIVYGFGFNVGYRNFYISTFFQGVANSSINVSAAYSPFSFGVDDSNYRTFGLNRWTAENPSQDVEMPRLHMTHADGSNNRPASTWWLRNGAFLRFKNFEFGYNIPKDFMNKYKLGTARIYVMGNNLAVWDHVKHWDPETGNENAGLNYPLPRTYTFGFELSF